MSEVSPFGLWVKERRERQGLSMRDLAARTSGACTHGVIGQLETGRGGKRGPFRPSVEIVDAIAKALGENIDEARQVAGYAPRSMSAGYIFRIASTSDEAALTELWKSLTPEQQEAVRELVLSTMRSLAEVSREITGPRLFPSKIKDDDSTIGAVRKSLKLGKQGGGKAKTG